MYLTVLRWKVQPGNKEKSPPTETSLLVSAWSAVRGDFTVENTLSPQWSASSPSRKVFTGPIPRSAGLWEAFHAPWKKGLLCPGIVAMTPQALA